MDNPTHANSAHVGSAQIADLSQCQLVDPQRGPFRVKATPARSPRFKGGRRVHVDAFGQLFTIRDGGQPAQVRV